MTTGSRPEATGGERCRDFEGEEEGTKEARGRGVRGRRGALGVGEGLAQDAVLEDAALLVHFLRRDGELLASASCNWRNRGAKREASQIANNAHHVLPELRGVGVEALQLLLDLVEIALDLLAVELCGRGAEARALGCWDALCVPEASAKGQAAGEGGRRRGRGAAAGARAVGSAAQGGGPPKQLACPFELLLRALPALLERDGAGNLLEHLQALRGGHVHEIANLRGRADKGGTRRTGE